MNKKLIKKYPPSDGWQHVSVVRCDGQSNQYWKRLLTDGDPESYDWLLFEPNHAELWLVFRRRALELLAATSALGVLIVGTLEKLTATALISGGSREKDGSVTLEYSGSTDVDWDTQETVRSADTDGRIFVDEHGGTHEESTLIWTPAEAQPQ